MSHSSIQTTLSFNNPSNFYRHWYYSEQYENEYFHLVGARDILVNNQFVIQTGGNKHHYRSGYMSVANISALELVVGAILKTSLFPTQPTYYYTHSYVDPNSPVNYIVSCQDTNNHSILQQRHYYHFNSCDAPFNKSVPTQRSFHAVAPASEETNNNEFYLFGGKLNMRHDSMYLNDLWKVTVIVTTDNSIDEIKYFKVEASNAPSKRYGHTMVLCQHYLIVFGGYDSNGFYCNDMYSFDLKNQQWQVVEYTNVCPVQKTGLMHHTCVVMNGKLCIYGGKAKTNEGEDVVFDSLLLFDWETKKWSQVKHFSSQTEQEWNPNITTLRMYNACGKRYGHLCFVEKDTLQVYFGTDGFEEYLSGYAFHMPCILSYLQKMEDGEMENGYIVPAEVAMIESIAMKNMRKDKCFRFGYTFASGVMLHNHLFLSPSVT